LGTAKLPKPYLKNKKQRKRAGDRAQVAEHCKHRPWVKCPVLQKKRKKDKQQLTRQRKGAGDRGQNLHKDPESGQRAGTRERCDNFFGMSSTVVMPHRCRVLSASQQGEFIRHRLCAFCVHDCPCPKQTMERGRKGTDKDLDTDWCGGCWTEGSPVRMPVWMAVHSPGPGSRNVCLQF
jgi:hypothetical protein